LPLAAIPCIALATGSRLHLNWAAAYLPLTCAALSQVIAPATWRQVRIAHVWIAFGLVQLVAMAMLATSIHRASPVFDPTKQRCFAAAEVAAAIGPAARAAIGGPIRVIAGPQR